MPLPYKDCSVCSRQPPSPVWMHGVSEAVWLPPKSMRLGT